MTKNHNYTQQQIDWLTERREMLRRELAAAFNEKFGTNISVDAIKGLCQRHKIYTGRTGFFKPGHVPHNNGKKMPKHQQGLATQFKRGNIPKNHLPVGTERIINNGNSKGYIRVKIGEPAQWEFKHRLVYMSKNGPIPKGHAVVFVDGNPSNCDISNLRCVSRSILLRLNAYHAIDFHPQTNAQRIALYELIDATDAKEHDYDRR